MKSLVILAAFLFVVILADEEELEHVERQKHEVDGEHNVEYDHQAVIGSKKEHEEISKLSPEESKKRLSELVDRMDTNKDGKITKEELIKWVYGSFIKMDAEEAEDYFEEQDKDGDKFVTFKEYTVGYYGYEPNEINDWKDDKNEEMKEMAKLIQADEVKFKKADANGDDRLTLKEYSAFYHPWDHEYMHDYEIDRTLEEQDTNKDGVIDLKEYLGSETANEEDQIIETENFKSFDKNNDGKLDRDEIQEWVIPDHMETAKEEAEHLVQETDEDKDGVLSKAEIMDKHELWVGSAATDYGTQINEKYNPHTEL